MPQTVDPMFAQEVLEWWIEHADEALKDGRSGRREHEFCRSGTKTDVMLARELQTRRVIGITLGINVDALIRPLGRHNFVELQSGLDLARRALGKLKTAEETARHISGTVAPSMAADSLHPLIWDAASKLWNDGHLTAAVQRAATFLNAHVQDLTGRHDVSEAAFVMIPVRSLRNRKLAAERDCELSATALSSTTTATSPTRSRWSPSTRLVYWSGPVASSASFAGT